MEPVFADTFYWLALLNPGDDWHQEAIRYAHQNPDLSIVTTDGVLDEVLNYASTRGTFVRQKALRLCTRIVREPKMRIVAYSPELRQQGFLLYGQRPDKAYSVTDCISMVVMQQMNIHKVLTYDKHFAQEGFVIIFQ